MIRISNKIVTCRKFESCTFFASTVVLRLIHVSKMIKQFGLSIAKVHLTALSCYCRIAAMESEYKNGNDQIDWLYYFTLRNLPNNSVRVGIKLNLLLAKSNCSMKWK